MLRTMAMLLVIGAAACSGGGGGGDDSGSVSSIAGVGVTQGPITGVGSRIVGGTEWDMNGAEIVLDGEPGFMQVDLRVGMQVVVEGERSQDARTGTATRVEYDDAVEGYILSITDVDADTKKLSVLGQTVIVRRDETIFEGTTSTGLVAASFDNLVAGASSGFVIEVSGPVNAAGEICASLVTVVGPLGPNYGVTIVERKGTVSSLVTTPGSESFLLDGIEVLYDTIHTDLSALPGGLADGQRVEAVGILKTSSQILTDDVADPGSIRLLTDPLPADAENVDVEGFVTAASSAADFELDGRAVDASMASFSPSVSGGFVAPGAQLAVEGDLVGGVLEAQTVRLRAGDVRIDAAIAQTADVNAAAGSFELLGIAVRVDDSTVFQDELSANVVSGLGGLNLVSNDFVAVRGIETTDGVLATHVTRRASSGAIQLRGKVDGWSFSNSITILGVQIGVASSVTAFDGDSSSGAALLFLGSLHVGDLLQIIDAADGNKAAIDTATEVNTQS
jgi:Domain of unknown function (DUF5666)